MNSYDFWLKEPFKLWEDWCRKNEPPLIRRTDKDQKHGWHYELQEKIENDGQTKLKFKLHKECRSEFEDLKMFEECSENVLGEWKGKDAKKLKNQFGEKILIHLREQDALMDIVLPSSKYDLDRGDAKREVDKFLKDKKLVEKEHYEIGSEMTSREGCQIHRYYYKFKDTSKVKFGCLRGKVLMAYSPEKRQAAKNCAQLILDAIDQERKNRDSKNKQAEVTDNKNSKPEFDEILFCHGVRNRCNRFIEIRDGEFEDLKTDEAESRNYVPKPIDKLKEIQNRKDVEFSYVILWPKLKRKNEIKLPESEDEEKQKQSFDLSENQPNINRPYSRSVYQCILKTFTRPPITVIGRGRSQDDAENDAAKKCLYHLHIQTRPELNWAGLPLTKLKENQEVGRKESS